MSGIVIFWVDWVNMLEKSWLRGVNMGGIWCMIPAR